MSHYGKHPRLERETPAVNDEVWYWFVCNGPHGEGFEWGPALRQEGGHLGLLREFIDERSESFPDFKDHARLIAVEALHSDDTPLILKAIHVLTAIGTDEEMLFVRPFTEDDCEVLAKHARAALFERRIKAKSK